MKIELPIGKMVAASHNFRVAALRELGLRSFKPPGHEEMLVPFTELTRFTQEREAWIMQVAVEELKEAGYVIFSRGFVIFTALLLGTDIALTIMLLRFLW